jgi:hypothetical protein
MPKIDLCSSNVKSPTSNQRLNHPIHSKVAGTDNNQLNLAADKTAMWLVVVMATTTTTAAMAVVVGSGDGMP